MKRGACDDTPSSSPRDADDEATTGEIRRAVKRLRTADEPPGLGAMHPFRDHAQHAPGVACVHPPPGALLDAGAMAAAAPADASPARGADLWSMRGARVAMQSSPATPDPSAPSAEAGPGRAQTAANDNEPDRGEYAEVNSLLRELHFERLARAGVAR